MTNAKQAAADALSDLFKTYRHPVDQFEGPGFEALVTCAIQSISAANDGEGATEDEVVAFTEGLKLLLTQSALLALVREGAIATTVQNGEIAFAHINPNS